MIDFGKYDNNMLLNDDTILTLRLVIPLGAACLCLLVLCGRRCWYGRMPIGSLWCSLTVWGCNLAKSVMS